MTSQKIIAVVGATGNQGSSVAKTFLGYPNWHVRALTRNPSSEKAQALASQGAEIRQVDLEDQASLEKAFEGVHAIFLLTDFWATYIGCLTAGKSRDESSQEGLDVEVRHTMNAARAAAGIPTLERLVYSALGPMKEASKGKFNRSFHWESKAAGIKFIKTELPELAKKTSYFHCGCYPTNAFLLPKKDAATGSEDFVMLLPVPKSLKMPIIDTAGSAGMFVRCLIEDESPGVHLCGYDSYIAMEEVLDIWIRTAGIPARYEETGLEDMHERTGVPHEVLDGAPYLFEYHYMAGLDNVLWADDLKNKPKTQSYEQWLQKQGREYLLGGAYPRF